MNPPRLADDNENTTRHDGRRHSVRPPQCLKRRRGVGSTTNARMTHFKETVRILPDDSPSSPDCPTFACDASMVGSLENQ